MNKGIFVLKVIIAILVLIMPFIVLLASIYMALHEDLGYLCLLVFEIPAIFCLSGFYKESKESEENQ